jgi:hypothetical protein
MPRVAPIPQCIPSQSAYFVPEIWTSEYRVPDQVPRADLEVPQYFHGYFLQCLGLISSALKKMQPSVPTSRCHHRNICSKTKSWFACCVNILFRHHDKEYPAIWFSWLSCRSVLVSHRRTGSIRSARSLTILARACSRSMSLSPQAPVHARGLCLPNRCHSFTDPTQCTQRRLSPSSHDSSQLHSPI